jgi:glycosyltransferase involved in cell wall biosynthesis
MHIVQLISHYVPATRFGGPQRVAHGLGRALARAGHRVTVCCTNLADERSDLDVPLDTPVDVEGVTVFYEATILSRYWGFAPQLRRRAAREIRQADVVLVHFHYQFANLLGATLARRCAKPYLIFAHGSFQRAGISRRSAWKKNLYLKWIEGKNIAAADHIVFNAEEEQENSRFAQQGIVLPNGIAPEELALPQAGIFRKCHPEIGEKTLLLFLGRIDYCGKGLDLLLDAFGQVKGRRSDIHLVLAGPSERDGMQQTQRRVASLKLDCDVTLTGLIEGPDKLAALADADAFLLPSRSEGLSIALLEALCCGLPVLVTDRVGLHEFVAETGAGVVVPVSTAGIQQGLERLLDDDARTAMRGAASARIRQEFSWDQIAQDLLAILARDRQPSTPA